MDGKEIILKVKGKKVKFDSKTNTVEFKTRHGVDIKCDIPEKWALTRTFQFMDSLMKASDILI